MDYARNFTPFVTHRNVPIVLISVTVIEGNTVIVPAMLGKKDTDREEKKRVDDGCVYIDSGKLQI